MVLLAFLISLAPAEPPPVVVNRCLNCHGPTKQRGGLRLDSDGQALKGGDSGSALTPGKPEASAMLQRVKATGQERMPPDGPRLSSSEISELSMWISKLNPSISQRDDRLDHWSFRPLVRPPVPPMGDQNQTTNPVDAFVRARLFQAGLTPSPERRDHAARLTQRPAATGGAQARTRIHRGVDLLP